MKIVRVSIVLVTGIAAVLFEAPSASSESFLERLNRLEVEIGELRKQLDELGNTSSRPIASEPAPVGGVCKLAWDDIGTHLLDMDIEQGYGFKELPGPLKVRRFFDNGGENVDEIVLLSPISEINSKRIKKGSMIEFKVSNCLYNFQLRNFAYRGSGDIFQVLFEIAEIADKPE